jgi:hypothetical protein
LEINDFGEAPTRAPPFSPTEGCVCVSFFSSTEEEKKEERTQKRSGGLGEKKRGRLQTEWPPGFREFWEAYPRQTDADKAIAVWTELDPDQETQAEILEGIRRLSRSGQWRRGAIHNPDNFLRGKHWGDRLPEWDTGPDKSESADERRKRLDAQRAIEEKNKRLEATKQLLSAQMEGQADYAR